MFRNIKKISESAWLYQRLVYNSGKEPVPAESAAGVEKPTAQSLAALRAEMEKLVYVHEGKMREILLAGQEYKSGDWPQLNERFTREFAKEGVEPARSMALLMRFQKEAFDALNLNGDRFAVADGQLGPYTLYAFAIYFNLPRPKVPLPSGSSKLEKLINEDIEKAFGSYKKFDFAKEAKLPEFKKIYADIKVNTSFFNSERADLGEWAIALVKAGYDGEKVKGIGFPTIIDKKTYGGWNSKYTFLRPDDKLAKKVTLALERGDDKTPIFVDEEGKMYVRKRRLEPVAVASGGTEYYEDELQELFDSGAKWASENPYAPTPPAESPKKEPKKKDAPPVPVPPKPETPPVPEIPPTPKAPPTASELIIANKIGGAYKVGENEYIYRTKDNKWIDYDGKEVPLETLSKIEGGEKYAGYYKVTDTSGNTSYVDERDGSSHYGMEVVGGETVDARYARIKKEEEAKKTNA